MALLTRDRPLSWNPDNIFHIYNPQMGRNSCVGNAPSKGRRCQNRVNHADVSYAQRLIRDMACREPESVHLSELCEIASLCLCTRYHRNGQERAVAEEWKLSLSLLARDRRARIPAQSVAIRPSTTPHATPRVQPRSQLIDTGASSLPTPPRTPTRSSPPPSRRRFVTNINEADTVTRTSRRTSSIRTRSITPTIASPPTPRPRAVRETGEEDGLVTHPQDSPNSSTPSRTPTRSPPPPPRPHVVQEPQPATPTSTAQEQPMQPPVNTQAELIITLQQQISALQQQVSSLVAASETSTSITIPQPPQSPSPSTATATSETHTAQSEDTFSEPQPVFPLPQAPVIPQCTTRHAARKPIRGECPICYETMANLPLEDLLWCKTQCGINLHRECWDEWAEYCEDAGISPRCIQCRTTWSMPCEHDIVPPCTTRHVTRRQIRGECPVCYETLTNLPLEDLIWCKAQCGINMHKECWDMWAEYCEDAGRIPGCVQCRTTWSIPCDHDIVGSYSPEDEDDGEEEEEVERDDDDNEEEEAAEEE